MGYRFCAIIVAMATHQRDGVPCSATEYLMNLFVLLGDGGVRSCEVQLTVYVYLWLPFVDIIQCVQKVGRWKILKVI